MGHTVERFFRTVRSNFLEPYRTDARRALATLIRLYDVLLRVELSPVVALNRAVAIAMRDEPELGLATLETVLEQGGLDGYSLAHAALNDASWRRGCARLRRCACPFAKPDPPALARTDPPSTVAIPRTAATSLTEEPAPPSQRPGLLTYPQALSAPRAPRS
jgi:hypothetical protein